ncbi:hypothetical protein Ocin01_18715 [Orchesella cincta]|uniref:Uncharacterized protein n=1 Tax=Orchesella cincta TaxID=48709 RepID=A0A1D2M4Q4_ORCCI|nr:hypothetical protein Ocin01_18715 [Orchesella cincta]
MCLCADLIGTIIIIIMGAVGKLDDVETASILSTSPTDIPHEGLKLKRETSQGSILHGCPLGRLTRLRPVCQSKVFEEASSPPHHPVFQQRPMMMMMIVPIRSNTFRISWLSTNQL